jgi:hypothetical protein
VKLLCILAHIKEGCKMWEKIWESLDRRCLKEYSVH